MWNHLKTFGIVTVFTLLIWAFAEAESLTTKTVRVDVAFMTDPQSGRVLDVPEGQGWNGRVEMVFEGSTASVGDLESILRKGLVLRAGMDGVPADPGEHTIELRQALRSAPQLESRGVTIVKVDPPAVRVVVDTLVKRDLKVLPDATGAVVDGAIECKPATVRLTLPRSLSDLLPENASVIARIGSDTIKTLVPGRNETVNGILLLPPRELDGRSHISIEPDHVDVSLKLRLRNDSYTIASVPVHVKIAVGELGRWNVTVPEEDRFIRDVKVSGPGDQVDRIRRGEIRITAILPLSFDELERGITNKDVTFAEVPTDLKFDAERMNVRLTITRREAPAAAPANP